jgi:SAM-dependent methyltransferase
MRIREPWPQARSRQRRREFSELFRGLPPGGLGDALEIGGGDGYVASLVAPCCRTLLSTDSYAREPAPGTEGLRRLVCDANRLPFADDSFDFIFSSSLLEHIRDRENNYRETLRCLRPGGIMIHVMPSRTWKLLQLIFYYPHLVVGAIDLLLDALSPTKRASAAAAKKRRTTAKNARWSDESRLPTWREIVHGVLPTVHGEFSNHESEWLAFGAAAWALEFRAHGLEVERVVPLPLYSGYGFGFERLRRAGERHGLSSHNAFVLARAGETPPSLAWFADNSV